MNMLDLFSKLNDFDVDNLIKRGILEIYEKEDLNISWQVGTGIFYFNDDIGSFVVDRDGQDAENVLEYCKKHYDISINEYNKLESFIHLVWYKTEEKIWK